MKYKICTKCWLEKSIQDFHKSWKWKYHTRCKPCKILYYSENKEKYNIKMREWSKTEKWRIVDWNKKHRRRELIKRWNDLTVTQEALDDMLLMQNSLCNNCKVNIENRSERHLDHIYPLSRWWLHTITNLQWLCVMCNLKKWSSVL